ncbi:MAG: hypothetical protein ACI8ZB_000202 [Desulforhopalus sp.]|jgi:hypothetical protein
MSGMRADTTIIYVTRLFFSDFIDCGQQSVSLRGESKVDEKCELVLGSILLTV